MKYTDDALKSLSYNLFMRNSYGIFLDVPIDDKFSVAPEILFSGRGTIKNYTNKYNEEVNYCITSNYINIRLPFIYRYNLSNILNPYFYISPVISCLLGGTIELDEQSIDIGSANMSNISVGSAVGCGLRLNFDYRKYHSKFKFVTKLDVAYCFGITDTYSDMEKLESAISNNVYAYNITGKRFNRGFEFTLGFAFPLKFERDVCKGFYNNYDKYL